MWAYHVGPWGARAKPPAPAHHWTKGHGHGVVRTGTGPAVAAFPNLGKIRRRTHQFFFKKTKVLSIFRLTRHADGCTSACPSYRQEVGDAHAARLTVTRILFFVTEYTCRISMMVFGHP
jgi:hypothetical protein